MPRSHKISKLITLLMLTLILEAFLFSFDCRQDTIGKSNKDCPMKVYLKTSHVI